VMMMEKNISVVLYPINTTSPCLDPRIPTRNRVLVTLPCLNPPYDAAAVLSLVSCFAFEQPVWAGKVIAVCIIVEIFET